MLFRSAMTLYQLVDGQFRSPRVYLLDETKQNYEMLKLTGNEFTFDVDVSRLPCGMNSALYLSEMLADGGKSALNTGGANFGTGYCDAQCYTTPFINGEGNIEGYGACCGEMVSLLRHCIPSGNLPLTNCTRTSGRPTPGPSTSPPTLATSPSSTNAPVRSANSRVSATSTAAPGTRTASSKTTTTAAAPTSSASTRPAP